MLHLHHRGIVFLALSLCTIHNAFGDPSKADPQVKPQLLVDDGEHLWILSDRQEKVTEFFQRNRVVVGSISQEDFDKLRQAKEPIKGLLLHGPSANDDPKKADLFAAKMNLAPLSTAVATMIDNLTAPQAFDGNLNLTVIVRRDSENAEVHHIVGLTMHSSINFFEQAEKLVPGTTSPPVDLKHKGK